MAAKKTPEQRIDELEREVELMKQVVAGTAGAAVFMVGALCDAAPEMRVPMLQRLKGRLKFQPTPDPEMFQRLLKYLIRDIETMMAPPPRRH